MNKVKTNTAATVDGVRKPHMRKEVALFLLPKLSNSLMILKAYPDSWKINRTTLNLAKVPGILKTGGR